MRIGHRAMQDSIRDLQVCHRELHACNAASQTPFARQHACSAARLPSTLPCRTAAQRCNPATPEGDAASERSSLATLRCMLAPHQSKPALVPGCGCRTPDGLHRGEAGMTFRKAGLHRSDANLPRSEEGVQRGDALLQLEGRQGFVGNIASTLLPLASDRSLRVPAFGTRHVPNARHGAAGASSRAVQRRLPCADARPGAAQTPRTPFKPSSGGPRAMGSVQSCGGPTACPERVRHRACRIS